MSDYLKDVLDEMVDDTLVEARRFDAGRLDPRPLRPHDSEGDINENIPFDQWWNEPRQIARLYRWLKMRDRLPEDPADFIENAWTWHQDFDDMCMWAGPA